MNAESSPQRLASPFGFSVGHWEEDALVVHTTHVNWPYMGGPSGGGAPQSEQASYRETFALSSEEDDVLKYEIIVTDPIMFTEPFIHRSDWRWTPGVELESYECVADWEESTR